jgi:hypothetical protein
MLLQKRLPNKLIFLLKDNKVMMVATPSVGTLDEVITTNVTGRDKNINLEKRTTLEKLRARLRVPVLFDIVIIVIGKSINSLVIEIYNYVEIT